MKDASNQSSTWLIVDEGKILCGATIDCGNESCRNRSHMTKISATPVYGKNLQKSLVGRIQ